MDQAAASKEEQQQQPPHTLMSTNPVFDSQAEKLDHWKEAEMGPGATTTCSSVVADEPSRCCRSPSTTDDLAATTPAPAAAAAPVSSSSPSTMKPDSQETAGLAENTANSTSTLVASAVMQSACFEVDKFSIGYTPVDIRGRPLLDLSKTGGWRAAFFIFGNETAERMAFYGILVNLIFYLYYEMHINFPSTSTLVTNVIGTASLTPLLGAFVADAYLGRYYTIGIFSMIYLVGLILLTLTSVLADTRPSNSGCGIITLYLGFCAPASTRQMAFLYVSLYTIALGSGGIRPCVSSFGADQFDIEDPKEKLHLARFFNGFYFMITLGIFLSLTLVVYVSDYVSWGWGFGTLAIAMGVANIIFFMGTPFYRHRLPSGSPLTRLAQVLVASTRKRKVQVPSDESLLHEVHDKESAIVGSRKLHHVNDLRFLDKAAVETEEDKISGTPVTAWRLCTVTQVEEMKALLRVIPIWATSIVLNTVFVQILNFGAQQAMNMDRRLWGFNVPAASVPVVSAMFILLFIPLYDCVLVPFIGQYTRNPRGISYLQRTGVGLFASILAAVAAALVEKKRRQVSWETRTAGDPLLTVPFSAWWLIIPFFLTGFAEVFASIGQLEFFYDQAPDGMRSMGTAFFAATSGLGAYLGSFLITVTSKITGKHGKSPWVNNVISIGHIDYYFWLLAVLSSINLIAFIYFVHMYRYKVEFESTMRSSLVKALVSNGNKK
jgi:peptide/histidine transporter 3/4